MLNSSTIQGRLIADPELRSTQTGTPVCSFRVAWSEKYKETETKLFLSCTAWRGTGELVSKHFAKGKEIIVEGKLFTREWTDKEGGKRSTVEMTVEKVHFCGPKEEGSASSTYRGASSAVNVEGPGDFAELDDDGTLPF